MTLRDLIDSVGDWFAELLQVFLLQSNWLDSSLGHVFWAGIGYFVLFGWAGASWEKLSLAFVTWKERRAYDTEHKNDEDYNPDVGPILRIEDAFWALIGLGIGGFASLYALGNLLRFLD